MNILYAILTVLYEIFLVVICGFIVWNVFRTRKMTEKVIGALALIMFILRILFIK